jgi:hypothetical protein
LKILGSSSNPELIDPEAEMIGREVVSEKASECEHLAAKTKERPVISLTALKEASRE